MQREHKAQAHTIVESWKTTNKQKREKESSAETKNGEQRCCYNSHIMCTNGVTSELAPNIFFEPFFLIPLILHEMVHTYR